MDPEEYRDWIAREHYRCDPVEVAFGVLVVSSAALAFLIAGLKLYLAFFQ